MNTTKMSFSIKFATSQFNGVYVNVSYIPPVEFKTENQRILRNPNFNLTLLVNSNEIKAMYDLYIAVLINFVESVYTKLNVKDFRIFDCEEDDVVELERPNGSESNRKIIALGGSRRVAVSYPILNVTGDTPKEAQFRQLVNIIMGSIELTNKGKYPVTIPKTSDKFSIKLDKNEAKVEDIKNGNYVLGMYVSPRLCLTPNTTRISLVAMNKLVLMTIPNDSTSTKIEEEVYELYNQKYGSE